MTKKVIIKRTAQPKEVAPRAEVPNEEASKIKKSSGRPRNSNGMLGKKVVSVDISADFMHLFNAIIDEVCDRLWIPPSGALRDILLNALANGDVEKLFGSIIRKEGKDRGLSLRELAERRLEKWKAAQVKLVEQTKLKKL